jgi:DNA-binding response OmpR family regulator
MRHSQETAGLVLVVEDNRNISEMIGEYLEGRGFEVDYATDGLDGYRLAVENSYDVLVLDLMLPRLDGMEVCKRLRTEARKSTPVLMLTARDTLDDKLTGLSSGADDYLTKPFAFEELLARIEALLRRGREQQPKAQQLQVADLVLDRERMQVTRGGSAIALTAKELAFLELLMSAPGRVFSRERILSNVWGANEDPLTNIVDVYVRRLRNKIDDGHALPLLKTVRGLGYRIDDAP